MARLIDADAINYIEIGKGKIEIALASDIDKIPTISPDEVRGVGEWLPDVGEFGFPEIPCSVCGYKSGHYGFNYCPSCGARMTRAEAEKATEAGG